MWPPFFFGLIPTYGVPTVHHDTLKILSSANKYRIVNPWQVLIPIQARFDSFVVL